MNTDQPARPHQQTTVESRQVSSKSLLAGAKEVLIQHADQIYRLRETRSGKLIMHK